MIYKGCSGARIGKGYSRMYGRLLLASVAALSIGHLNSVRSMPLSDARGGVLPGFLRMVDRHDPGQFYNATDAGTTEVPADAFENAASRGVASLAASERPPGLEEMIATAGLGSGLYSSFEDAAAQQLPVGTGPTIRDLAQVLVNRPEPLPDSNNGGAGRPGRGGYSLFNAIMETQLDADFIEVATEVVTPTVTADGVIALSFLGLREFAFVVSPVTNRIQVMDFQTGTTVTLSRSAYDQRPQPEPLSSAQQRPHRPRLQTLAPALMMRAVLAKTKRFFSGYVLHPFTLGFMALFAIFWLVLRMARRAG